MRQEKQKYTARMHVNVYEAKKRGPPSLRPVRPVYGQLNI